MHGWERHGVVWAIDTFTAPCDFPWFTGCQGFPSCQWWQIPILWFPAVLRNSQAIKMVKILVPNSSSGFPNCQDGDINPFPGCPVFSDSQSVIRRRWNAVTLNRVTWDPKSWNISDQAVRKSPPHLSRWLEMWTCVATRCSLLYDWILYYYLIAIALAIVHDDSKWLLPYYVLSSDYPHPVDSELIVLTHVLY